MRAALLTAVLLLASPNDEERLVPAELVELWSRGERDRAVERLEALVAEAPGSDTLVRTLVEWQLALRRYGAAWEHLEHLDASFDSARGRVLYLLGRYEEALRFLDARDPAETLLRLDALEALGRNEAFESALATAAEVLGDDHPRVRTSRGRRLALEGEHERATLEFRAALATDPLAQDARFGLGRSLLVLGRRDEGVRVLEEHRRLVPLVDRLEFARVSLDLAPDHAPNHAAVGDAERALGRIEAADEAYARAERLARPEELTPIALRRARLWFEELDDLDRALAVLDSALARVPDVRLHVRAGDYLRRAGRGAEAAMRYRSALELRPGDRAIEARLAELESGARR